MIHLDALPAGIAAPGYDLGERRAGIVHLGLGGFHRAHMARYIHDLMARDPDARQWAIIGAGLRASDRPLIDALNAQHGLYTLTERDADGETVTLIASILRAIDASHSAAALLAAIDDPAIRIVSLTVTEHGYCLDRATRRLDLAGEAIAADLSCPQDPRTAIGVLVEALRRRRAAGLPAFSAMSCDNIPHNGAVLRGAVLDLADARDPALADWIRRDVAFPDTMVDRITPVPTEADIAAFERRTGLADRAALMAEPFRQWVIEDAFPAGRPAWETVGVQVVPDVAPYERMKLRLLNTSHLVIAGMGFLAGHGRIDETMRDPLIRRTMAALMDRETGPTLAPVPGIDLKAYKHSLLARFANPAIGDTVARVNADAPLNYLLDPIRDRLAAGAPIDLLALGLAAWLRRVRGEDEAGRRVTVVHPLADALREAALAGGADPVPLLSIRPLFGDLVDRADLVAVVGDWLGQLHAEGVAATLQQAAARGLI